MRRLAFAAVAALSVAAPACGGVESEPNLAQAAERTEAAGSFAVASTTTTKIDGRGTLETVCEGVVDIARRESRVACDPSDGAGFESITVGGRMYAIGPGSDGRWRSTPASDDDVLDEVAPQRMLAALRRASLDSQRVGEDEVRGEPTVRHALTVDCERMAFPVCDGEPGVVDVWIDGEGLVRRMAFDDGTGGSWVTEFFDFGETARVESPPGNLVDEAPGGPRCERPPGSPIPVEGAIDALRRAGFDVEDDWGYCGEGIAASLSNETIDLEMFDLVEEDGLLRCHLTTGPNEPTLLALPPPRPDFPKPVDRRLENLHCTLHASGSKANERVAALDAALDELKRELGP